MVNTEAHNWSKYPVYKKKNSESLALDESSISTSHHPRIKDLHGKGDRKNVRAGG